MIEIEINARELQARIEQAAAWPSHLTHARRLKRACQPSPPPGNGALKRHRRRAQAASICSSITDGGRRVYSDGPLVRTIRADYLVASFAASWMSLPACSIFSPA